MASFTAGTTFVDGVSNDVTAAKLGALVTNATPTSGFIQDRTAETVTATNDTLLIGDASDSNNLKRITVANFAQTLPTAKVTTGTIDTGTFGTTTSTAATITTGTIPTLTTGTTTSTAATITTGTIPTLVATTLVTTGTGTAAAPAIVPTGDTNTGIFFPAADTIAFSEGGAEAMRIDSSGNLNIGTVSAAGNTLRYVDVQNTTASASSGVDIRLITSDSAGTGTAIVDLLKYKTGGFTISNNETSSSGFTSFNVGASERMRIDSSGNVGIGTTSPATKLSVVASSNSGINVTNGTMTGILFNSSDTSIAIGTTSNHPVNLYANNSIAATISTSGNVGIGVTSPGSKLHISDSNVQLRFTNGSSHTRHLAVVDADNSFRITRTGVADDVTIGSNGNVGIGTTTPVNKLEITGSFGRGAPVTKTVDFTLADTENWIIVNKGSAGTATLPAASSWTGREFTIKVITAHTVVSASSNVVPRNSATAGTAILAAAAGNWATLVSNGTNWVAMCGS